MNTVIDETVIDVMDDVIEEFADEAVGKIIGNVNEIKEKRNSPALDIKYNIGCMIYNK